MLTTQERILDQAEIMFARQGVAATSLRSITAEAGVNAAAIHYHFGSKEVLLEAVLKRRIAPLNQERLKRLEALEIEAGDGPLPVEALLAAFLSPLFTMRAEVGGYAGSFAGLLTALRMEEHVALRPVIAEQFRVVKARFAAALCRGRDDLGPVEASERLDYCAGAFGHLLVDSGFLAPKEGGVDLAAVDRRLARMIRFLAPGLRSPASLTREGALR